MPDCPTCESRLVRRHRAAYEKLLYSEVFDCPKCNRPVRLMHRVLRVGGGFTLSRYTCCPRCGNDSVQRLAKRDRVDSFSKHPVSRLQGWVGAPVHRCSACRVQYYDWRPRHGRRNG